MTLMLIFIQKIMTMKRERTGKSVIRTPTPTRIIMIRRMKSSTYFVVSETPIFGIDTLSNSTPNENPNQRLPTNENINSISTLDPTIMVVNPPHHHPIRWTTITVMDMTMSMPQMQIQMQMSMHHHPQQQRQILHSNQAIMSFDGKS